jgi:hypothetical protein
MQCPVLKLKTFLCSNVPGGPRCWHPAVFGFPAVFASVLLMPSLLLLMYRQLLVILLLQLPSSCCKKN